MDMKDQLNVKTYWKNFLSILHCLIINNILLQLHFKLLKKCLHVKNLTIYISDCNLLRYDKIGQMRELVDKVEQSFQRA